MVISLACILRNNNNKAIDNKSTRVTSQHAYRAHYNSIL